MGVACKGVCEMFKSTGISMKLKYQEGQKRCSHCGVFLKFGGIRCPCCRTILRTKARNRNSKENRITNRH